MALLIYQPNLQRFSYQLYGLSIDPAGVIIKLIKTYLSLANERTWQLEIGDPLTVPPQTAIMSDEVATAANEVA